MIISVIFIYLITRWNSIVLSKLEFEIVLWYTKFSLICYKNKANNKHRRSKYPAKFMSEFRSLWNINYLFYKTKRSFMSLKLLSPINFARYLAATLIRQATYNFKTWVESSKYYYRTKKSRTYISSDFGFLQLIFLCPTYFGLFLASYIFLVSCS